MVIDSGTERAAVRTRLEASVIVATVSETVTEIRFPAAETISLIDGMESAMARMLAVTRSIVSVREETASAPDRTITPARTTTSLSVGRVSAEDGILVAARLTSSVNVGTLSAVDRA